MYNETVPSLSERLAAGLSFLIFSIAGLLVNIIVGYALLKHRRFFYRYTFYVLPSHLLVASIGELLGQFIVVIPLTLSGRPLYGEGTLMIVLASMDTLFFMTMLFMCMLISINRFTETFSRSAHRMLFEGRRIHLISLVPWILGLFWTIFSTAIGCPKIFRHDVFYYAYKCDDPPTRLQTTFIDFSNDLEYIAPALMMALYLCIIFYIGTTPTKKTYKMEISILIQALLICCAFEANSLTFALVPQLAHGKEAFVVSLLLDYAIILAASINPIIMLIMNPRIRRTSLQLLGCRTPPPPSTNHKIFEVSSTDFRKIYSNSKLMPPSLES